MRFLAQPPTDTVVHLPVTVAALVGPVDLPGDLRAYAREFGERKGMVDAAGDSLLYAVRVWWIPTPAFPPDADSLTIALRTVWTERVRGAHTSGLIDVACMPAYHATDWKRVAHACP
ncbi:hypothetical protein ACIBSV_27235 [Embleya sp. NPDC050154]|uniref:hypothetical protein n=1 Tax=Embleya sp. NPDC050154 TaxID=3363988 RepID=UPI0037AF8C21